MSDTEQIHLTKLPVGGCGVIVEISDDEEMARLKSMGVCLGRRVEVILQGNPLILKVFGSRIGMSKRLADDVVVERCSTAPRCWEARHLFHGDESND